MKEIYSCQVQIQDRGVTFPLSNPIQVNEPIELNIKKYLNKWKHSMDLSNKFNFSILNKKIIGYGNV